MKTKIQFLSVILVFCFISMNAQLKKSYSTTKLPSTTTTTTTTTTTKKANIKLRKYSNESDDMYGYIKFRNSNDTREAKAMMRFKLIK